MPTERSLVTYQYTLFILQSIVLWQKILSCNQLRFGVTLALHMIELQNHLTAGIAVAVVKPKIQCRYKGLM